MKGEVWVAKTPAAERPEVRVIAENRRAHYDYFTDDHVEAGLVLTGTEICAIRAGRVHLREAYARVESGECFLFQMHVAAYDFGNRWNHDPTRPRKLLLHRDEIDELWRYARQGGHTLIPLRLYLKHGRAKVDIGLCRGKHEYDKRAVLMEKERQRDIERALADRGR